MSEGAMSLLTALTFFLYGYILTTFKWLDTGWDFALFGIVYFGMFIFGLAINEIEFIAENLRNEQGTTSSTR